MEMLFIGGILDGTPQSVSHNSTGTSNSPSRTSSDRTAEPRQPEAYEPWSLTAQSPGKAPITIRVMVLNGLRDSDVKARVERSLDVKVLAIGGRE